MDIITQGITKKLIHLDDESKYITYLNENKRRNFTNPEEKVQAETFLALILTYNYPPQRIRQFVKVTMGSETKEADIQTIRDQAKQLRAEAAAGLEQAKQEVEAMILGKIETGDML